MFETKRHKHLGGRCGEEQWKRAPNADACAEYAGALSLAQLVLFAGRCAARASKRSRGVVYLKRSTGRTAEISALTDSEQLSKHVDLHHGVLRLTRRADKFVRCSVHSQFQPFVKRLVPVLQKACDAHVLAADVV